MRRHPQHVRPALAASLIGCAVGMVLVVSGSGAAEFVAELDMSRVDVGGDGDRWLVRAADWATLGDALNGAERPSASRLRIEIDPPRV